MLDIGVWRHVNRKDHPKDQRLVGCRWVFKVKHNGVYCARLVAKGFSQIPGCRILGLTALNSLLQYVNWLVWEVCSVN